MWRERPIDKREQEQMDCKSDQADQSKPDHLPACGVMVGTWESPQPVQQKILNHRNCKPARSGQQDRYTAPLDQKDGDCEIRHRTHTANHSVFAELSN